MVTAVIVNWNGKHYLEACLEAVLAQDPPPAEVLLVDNHSTDGSRELVAERFPQVRVIDTGHNGGPGLARNVGVAAAAQDRVLLVDNDVVLRPGALASLGRVLDQNPDTALVQARSFCHDRPDVLHYDAADLHYLGLLLLRNFFRPRADAVAGESAAAGLGAAGGEGVAAGEGVVGAAVGLCVLVRRAAYQQVGGFHEELFFYFEDTDFAWRLRLAGHVLRLDPEAQVLHRGGTADLSMRAGAPMPPARTYYHSRNRWAVLLTCLHWRSLLLLFPAQLLYTLVHLLFSLSKGHGLVWLRGKAGLLVLLPRVLRWRAAAQRLRVVPDRDLLTAGPVTLNPGIAERGFAAALRRLLDRFYCGYWRIVRGLCG